ncbi:MAG: FHA domain-containing protein [Planctomycetota bacterium]
MSTSTAKLRFLTGKLEGKAYPLTKALILGRAPGIQGRIPEDSKVSREHAKVYPQGVDFYIVDLNSSNGTQVNDAPVTRRLLRDGDEVMIGETRFRFENPPEAQQAPAAPAKPAEKPKPVMREVIDLTKAPEPSKSSPAGALSMDEIVVKDRALQFSKADGRKKPNALFDDMGQRPFLYQAAMGLLVLALSIGFVLIGLKLAGVIGGGGE